MLMLKPKHLILMNMYHDHFGFFEWFEAQTAHYHEPVFWPVLILQVVWSPNSSFSWTCVLTSFDSLSVLLQFLSLGQRRSFEIAHIRVVLETSSKPSVGSAAVSGQSIDMERLRRDVDSMGDTVSDRAKAFLTTLEQFQKVWVTMTPAKLNKADSDMMTVCLTCKAG